MIRILKKYTSNVSDYLCKAFSTTKTVLSKKKILGLVIRPDMKNSQNMFTKNNNIKLGYKNCEILFGSI